METMHTTDPAAADAVVATLRLSGYTAYWCLHTWGCSRAFVIHYRRA